MKRLLQVGLIFLLGLLFLCSCSSSHVDEMKAIADARWKELGFSIVGYEGYQWGQWGIFGSQYGGAHVWYTLHKIPDNGIIYSGSLQKWGNEYHNTALRAYDAIKP